MKRSFTLIEVLISFSLAIIILTIGATMIHSFFRTQKAVSRHFEHSLKMYVRRSQVRSIVASMISVKERRPLLSYQSTSPHEKKLVFTRDNRYFRDPQLANEVIACLYLDDEGLKVALRADPTRKEMDQTKESVYLLWPNVNDISWKFLGKKNLSEQTLEWCDEWKEDEGLPLAVRIIVHIDGKEETLTIAIKETLEKKTPLVFDCTMETLASYFQQVPDDEEE